MSQQIAVDHIRNTLERREELLEFVAREISKELARTSTKKSTRPLGSEYDDEQKYSSSEIDDGSMKKKSSSESSSSDESKSSDSDDSDDSESRSGAEFDDINEIKVKK